MIKLKIIFLLLLTNLLSAQDFVKDGDVIFTKTKGMFYNQIGIIFVENDTPYVYHSDVVVFKMTLHEYLKTHRHSTRRLDIDGELMDKDMTDKMHSFAKSKVNKSYDGAKFVWDIYRQITGIPLCNKSEISVWKISRCYFLE